MTVEVELFDDLDAVARDAADALDRAATHSLFDRLDWFRLTLAHCPPPGRLLVARARDGEAGAWLFLAIDRGTARAFGSWYTLLYQPIMQGHGADALLPAIARALRRHRVARVELSPMADPSALEAAFRIAGWWTQTTVATVGWQVATGGMDFAEYWAGRPGQLRATVRRKTAKAGIDIRLFKQFDADAWDSYEHVYASSWKPTEGSPAFLRALAHAEGAAGTLRLGLARIGGEPVAAQFWLVENGVATIHKLAHVEAARASSPGTLLSVAMFRAAIDEDRVERIDFGTGNDPYKADWMDDPRPLYRLEAWNPATLRGLAGAARARFGSLVRRNRTG
jgi:CelD/BcsL family acetyltransferase involved in cellulose biosynthesis